MELHEYIEDTIYSVINGVRQADRRLREEGLGQVWTEDFNTHSDTLVSIKIVKGQVNGDTSRSVPVLVFDYDVNVVVEDKAGESSSAKASGAAKVISIFSFSGQVEGASDKETNMRRVQNLKFSIPVAISCPVVERN